MNTASSKTCPVCAETIPAAARVCPRCRQWLTLRSFRNPVTNTACLGLPALILFLVVMGVFLSRMDNILNPRPLYSEMPDSIRVLESRLLWVETTNGPRIYVVGMVTNQSAVAWKDLEFQCRFFDSKGSMIDAAYPSSRMTVQPGGDAAFRGLVVPGCPKPDYSRVATTVNSARNTRTRL